LPCRKEGYFKKNKSKPIHQNQKAPQPELSMLFNGIHPTGQEFPYRSGKKIPPPLLNITFHMVNPSESLLWNE